MVNLVGVYFDSPLLREDGFIYTIPSRLRYPDLCRFLFRPYNAAIEGRSSSFEVVFLRLDCHRDRPNCFFYFSSHLIATSHRILQWRTGDTRPAVGLWVWADSHFYFPGMKISLPRLSYKKTKYFYFFSHLIPPGLVCGN